MNYDKIYLKITTLPQTDNLSTESTEFKLFKDKYSEAREYMKDSDVLHSYYNDASKTSSFAKIYSMTIGVVKENTIHIVTSKGDEKSLLEMLIEKLKKEFLTAELVCFNLGFNLEFLTTRMLRHGIDTSSLPIQLKHLNMKVWNMKQCKGVSDHFKGIGWHHMNAMELFWTAGLPLEHILDGSETYRLYKDNQINLIDKSDVHYLKNLVNVERISVGEGVLGKYRLYYNHVAPPQEKQKTTESKEENPLQTEEDKSLVLKRIYVNNEITKEDKKELLELIGKKRMLKKDKPILIDMIHKLSLNSEIFSKDDSVVTEEKLKIVDKLINSL